jgi:hypothetical protein
MVREPIENEFIRFVESIERIGGQFLVRDINKNIYLYNNMFESGTLVVSSEQTI